MASGLEDTNLLPALRPLELSSAEDSLTEGELVLEPTPLLEAWHLLMELGESGLKHGANGEPLNNVSKHFEHLENLGPGRPQKCEFLLNLNTCFTRSVHWTAFPLPPSLPPLPSLFSYPRRRVWA